VYGTSGDRGRKKAKKARYNIVNAKLSAKGCRGETKETVSVRRLGREDLKKPWDTPNSIRGSTRIKKNRGGLKGARKLEKGNTQHRRRYKGVSKPLGREA